MRAITLVVCSFLAVLSAFGQSGGGTITGNVTDQGGAVISGASVQVKNTETGSVYPATTTDTGSYTAVNLPPGPYSITLQVPSFKQYVRTGITLSAAQTVSADISLEVGSATESITINAEATLLKTETGDVAHNITVEQLNDLPILGIGGANAGSSGVRNPYNSVVMIPGVSYNANFTMIVNGAPSNTAAYRVEGLDNTNHTVNYALQENQPSADAIQEVAVQTSNYAAEFGQAGGGLFNITMKSGTNQYHGSGYDYFVNEDLNAAVPFSNDGSGNKVRPRNRRNDFGGTIGGPIWIPKVYNGKNKTFFFFNFEEFREASGITPSDTLPTVAYRNGDFSSISPNGGAGFNPLLGVPTAPLYTDPIGQPVFANEIFDPTTRNVTATGQGYALPFPNNIIPPSRITNYAKAVQSLVPLPQNGNIVGNYQGYNLGQRISKIPSLKLDHNIGSKGKLSFFWGLTGTDSQYSTPNGGADGLPDIISAARGTFIHSLTERLNYDHVLTPTILLHFGAGYSRTSFIDTAPYTKKGNTFNCATLGIVGCDVAFNFPTIPSLVGGPNGSLGGQQGLGNALAHTTTITLRPSFNSNVTYIRGNHTYKLGGEVWFQGNITAPPSGVQTAFGVNATAEPFTTTSSLAGQTVGFQYASFLLGDASSTSQYAPQDPRMGKSQWGLFIQDAWKVNRKLTIDYGLRWDYATANREQYGRSADLGGNVPNPAAGGRLGAPIFEATCNCTFVKNYPYAVGPRLGGAYQLNDKTVLRGGWGLIYGFPGDIGASSSAQQVSTPAGINAFVSVTSPTALPQPSWPNFNPAQSPLPGQNVGFGGLTALDPNAARPSRQNQWSFNIQREVTKDFVMEVGYVGNVGVWWPGPLGYINQVSPATFAAFGLQPYTNPADNLLLNQALSSSAVVARIGNYVPYPGYATSNTLLNALRPYPQFSTITVTGSPTGKTWYDALQAKGTKRLSKGLQVNGTFTWSKALVYTREDLFNPASSTKSIQATDQPFLFNANILYITQKYFENRWLSFATKDWQLGAFLQYGSGLPLAPPVSTATNNLGASEQIRTGAPLFLKNLNCGCINPYVDQVLNPAAWTNPPQGTYGPGPSGAAGLYYADFRQARRPSESFNIARNFRVGKEGRYNLQIRAEFANIFNRLQIGNPSTVNPAGGLTRNASGQYSGGFGVINETVANGSYPTFTSNGNVGQLYQQPRQGTLIARFSF